VLGSGLRLEVVKGEGDKSQMLETLRETRTEIALAFGAPPEKFGGVVSGESLTYANRDQNNQQALLDSINPDLVVIQEILTNVLPRPQYVVANTGAFLRSDLATRYQAHATGIGAGFITVNEARAFENLPAIEVDGPEPANRSEPALPISLAVNVDARQEPPVVNVEPTVKVDARSTHQHTHRHDGAHVAVDARQEPPVVYVEPPVVNVVTPAPEVRATRKTIEHTPDGRIAAIIEEPA
jgi:Phage portal protein